MVAKTPSTVANIVKPLLSAGAPASPLPPAGRTAEVCPLVQSQTPMLVILAFPSETKTHQVQTEEPQALSTTPGPVPRPHVPSSSHPPSPEDHQLISRRAPQKEDSVENSSEPKRNEANLNATLGGQLQDDPPQSV